MPGPIAAIITLLGLIPQWIVNVIRVGALYTRLRREREDLKDLGELKQIQLASLRDGTGSLLTVIPGNRLIQMALSPGQETFLRIHLRMFNGSMFRIHFDEVRCDVNMSGRPLAFQAALENHFAQVSPGEIANMYFRLPIQDTTRTSLLDAIERHNRVNWRFDFRAVYEVAGEGVKSQLSENIVHEEIPDNP